MNDSNSVSFSTAFGMTLLFIVFCEWLHQQTVIPNVLIKFDTLVCVVRNLTVLIHMLQNR